MKAKQTCFTEVTREVDWAITNKALILAIASPNGAALAAILAGAKACAQVVRCVARKPREASRTQAVERLCGRHTRRTVLAWACTAPISVAV